MNTSRGRAGSTRSLPARSGPTASALPDAAIRSVCSSELLDVTFNGCYGKMERASLSIFG